MKVKILLIIISLSSVLLNWYYMNNLNAIETENKKLKQDNHELESQNAGFETEIKKLHETAQYHFQQGQDYIHAKNYKKAKAAFQVIIDKFPNDPLVLIAKQSIPTVEAQETAEIEQKRKSEAEAKELQEQEFAKSGEPIDYAVFYAKMITGNITYDKRYRFNACFSHTNGAECIQSEPLNYAQMTCAVKTGYLDDNSEYERFLESGAGEYCGPIVAELQNLGGSILIRINRLH